MRNLKRLLIFGLIFSLLSNGLVYSAVPTDAVDSPYKKAIEILGSLELMTGDSTGLFNPEETMTRAEFASVICKLIGLGEQAKELAATPFGDVAEDNAFSGSINLVYSKGIMKGIDQNTFEPESSITLEQALKIIVSVLGYDLYAAQYGGYPVGYMTVASEKRITKNVDGKASDFITRGQAAQLIYNSLKVDIMKRSVFGGSLDYTIEKGRTVLNEYLDIVTDTQQVTATADTSLNGRSALKDDEVEIGGWIYKVGKTNVYDYLGEQVLFYAKNDKEQGISTLLYVEADRDKSDVITVPADQIVRTQTTVSNFVYWTDMGKHDTTELDISPRVNVIYNGAAEDSFSDSDIMPEQGQVKLISSKNNSVYDIVIVTSIVNYVVQNVAVTPDEAELYDKYSNPPIIIDTAGSDVKLYVSKNGKKAKLSDAKEWDIVAVAESKNHDIFSAAIVSGKKVTGKVSETMMDGTKQKVVIGEKEYEVANNYRRTLLVDDSGTFYLDGDDKIAAFNGISSNSEKKVGYLLKMDIPKGLGSKIQFRIVDSQGKWHDCRGADKIALNGKIKTAEEIFQATALNDSANKIVTYDLNEKGELISINAYDSLVPDTRDNFVKPATEEITMKYMSNAKLFGGYLISDNVQIITLPSGDDLNSPDAFRVTKMSDFVHNNDYKIKPYYLSAASENLMRIDVIYYNKGGSGGGGLDQVSVEDAMAVVDDITQTLDEKGFMRDKVYLYSQGKRISVLSQAGKKANGIKKGDAILYKKSDDTLTGYLKLFNSKESMLLDFNNTKTPTFDGVTMTASEQYRFWDVGTLESGTDAAKYMYTLDKFTDTNTYKYTGDERDSYDAIYYCKVSYREGNYIKVTKVNNSAFKKVFVLPNNVCIYNKDKNKVSVGSNAAIQLNSTIVVKTRNSAVQDILVIE